MDRIWTAYLLCTRITLGTTALRVKLIKHTDWMGLMQTAYLLCTRITLVTTALRVIWTAYLLCTRITLETTALRVISSVPVLL